MNINEKIRRLRELKQLSQEEMATMLGMSTNGYAKIERGQRRLDIPKLEQIAAVLDVDMADWFAADTPAGHTGVAVRGILHPGGSAAPPPEFRQTLLHEIHALQLQLAHRDELLAAHKREIALLTELVRALQKQPE